MTEHKKLYSNELVLDGIHGTIDIFNDKNKGIKLNVCNTIDCLYYYIKGYLLCICDNKELNIIK